jgi:hypothetical protein
MTSPVFTRAAVKPWWISLIADASTWRAHTAIADAMLAALERALVSPKHPLHSQSFGYYARERHLAVADQQRRARIAANTFAPPLRRKKTK